MEQFIALGVIAVGASALSAARLPLWQSILGAMGVAVVIVSLLHPSISPTTVLYFAGCSRPEIHFAECHKQGASLVASKPQVFNANTETRTVVRIGGPFGTRRYTNCTVLDRLNWACPMARDAGWFALHNGQYTTILRPGADAEIKRCRRYSESLGQVSTEYWQYLRAQQLLTHYIMQPLQSLASSTDAK